MPRLAAAINDDPNEFAGHALWLLLLTGIRRNEILAAKWADADWDNKTLFIGKTKNGEPVLTPLSRGAIARLKLIPKLKDNPFIICGAIPGKPSPTWMRCGDGSERKLDFTTSGFMICKEPWDLGCFGTVPHCTWSVPS